MKNRTTGGEVFAVGIAFLAIVTWWMWFASYESACRAKPCPSGYERFASARPIACACREVTP